MNHQCHFSPIREAPASAFQRFNMQLHVAGWSNSNLHTMWRLKGHLDRESLVAALDAVLSRHEVLRTSITVTEQGPRQQIWPESPVTLTEYLIRSTVSLDDQKAHEEIASELGRPFDTHGRTLCRFSLFSCASTLDDHVLTLVMEHGVCDAISCGLLYQELEGLLFNAGLLHRTIDEPVRPAIQFCEYVEWERSITSSERGDFLRSQMAPTGYDVPAPPSPEPHEYLRWINSEVPLEEPTTENLKQLAGTLRTTLPIALFSALAAAFSPWTEGALRLGIMWSNRADPRFRKTVGPLTTLLPMRLTVSAAASLADTLSQTRSAWIQTLAHRVPLAYLLKVAETETIVSNSICDVVINFFPEDAKPACVCELQDEKSLRISPFSLNFDLQERAPIMEDKWAPYMIFARLDPSGALRCECAADTETLSKSDLAELGRYLGKSISLSSRSPLTPIGSLECPTPW